LNAPGTGYAPGDTINLAGGTQTTQAQVQVTTTKVVAAAIGVAGNGAIPNGVQTAVVLTGAGTAAQITVQVAGGVVVAINAIAVAGSYTTNPTTFLSQVLIAGNASCFLNLTMGVNSFNLIAPGVFTANPGGGTFTQGLDHGRRHRRDIQHGADGAQRRAYQHARAPTRCFRRARPRRPRPAGPASA
jgi:hypothetical protein